MTSLLFGGAVLVAAVAISASLRVLREYERAVVFRPGRLRGARGPGLLLLIPMVDRMERVSLRTVTLTIPPQEVITRDNADLDTLLAEREELNESIRTIVDEQSEP